MERSSLLCSLNRVLLPILKQGDQYGCFFFFFLRLVYFSGGSRTSTASMFLVRWLGLSSHVFFAYLLVWKLSKVMKLVSSCGLSSHVSFACLLAGMKIVHDIKLQGLSADWTSGLDLTFRRISLAIVVVLDQNFSVSDIRGLLLH